jgi:2-dehydro-3-deoxygalactonokinase
LIAVNWGTTNFRAYRIRPGGAIVDRRESGRGILTVDVGEFPSVLLDQVGDWLASGESTVLLAGMVGSRQGWKEAAYVACPGGIDELIEATVRVEFVKASVRLVPGMIFTDENSVPDVMRGEETEIMGVLDSCQEDDLICLPGTHSKWAQIRDGKIASFATVMTGEVYAALKEHTILSRLMTEGAVLDEAFERGLERSSDSGGLLHHLFGVRSLVLASRMKNEEASSYLSGLLIGHEIRSRVLEHQHVLLVGAAQLCRLYEKAILLCNGSCTIAREDAAARGLAAIGERLSWI